jgi:uncharacterized repeat protein (TIGR03803 family)
MQVTNSSLFRSINSAAVIGLLICAVARPAQAVTFTNLWSFGGSEQQDGFDPSGSLLRDKNGNLYGTTASGGVNVRPTAIGDGTVFELSPPTTNGGAWTETVIWNFGEGGARSDGITPICNLIMDDSGNLYGTTAIGGPTPTGHAGVGTVFKLRPPATSGGDWSESILFTFNGANGYSPESGVIMDKQGNLYGTTADGGALNRGVVFKLSPPVTSGGPWIETILWAFGRGSDGEVPSGNLVIDQNGNLYGETAQGGANGQGIAFKLAAPTQGGAKWSEQILWNFGSGVDGQAPIGGLTLDAAGNLYGTADSGGLFDGGIAFKLTHPTVRGGTWSESTLWDFGQGADGILPRSGVIMDQGGNLYGTTEEGGTGGADGGTVFKLMPPSASGGSWTEQSLWDFGGSSGSLLSNGVIIDPDGNLLGTTSFSSGSVFELSALGS